MALETAVYLNQLNSSNPLSTDVVSQADDHLRLIKQVLLNTFPNVTGPVTVTQTQLNAPPVPSGIITMWSGTIATIPSGWYLCDGTNGTPNLRDRFVVGAGSSYAVGDTGGANSVALDATQIPSHTHAITATGSSDTQGNHTHSVNDPGHTHTIAGTNLQGGTLYPLSGGGTDLNYVSAVAYTGVSLNSAGSHSHTITVSASASATGGGQAHENRPPYYALAYIMKA